MKKLILGIVGVFCLQVGFVAYNATEMYLDSASNANSVADPLSDAAETSVISDAESLIANTTEESTETKTRVFVFINSHNAKSKRLADRRNVRSKVKPRINIFRV